MKGTYYSGKFLKHRVSCHLCARLYAGYGERSGAEGGERGEKERKRGPQRWREEEGEEEEEEEESEKGVGKRESVSRGNQITRRGAQAGGLSFTVIN